MNGNIARMVRDKGFGFIRDADGVEWFFHRSAVRGSFDTLMEGDGVRFDAQPNTPKGPRAENVQAAAG